MLIKVESIRNKVLKRVLQHSFYLLVVLVIIPAYYYFELFVVLPTIVEEWTVPYFVHTVCGHFIFVNIIGNMIYAMFTNTSIKGRIQKYYKQNSSFCEVCECERPPRAWHCSTCDICILKRDHHCTFFACCIGYFNHRYFIMFTFYVFIGMVYGFYYNVKFVSRFITWNHGLVMLKFIFPLASIMLDFDNETLYVFLVVVNALIGSLTGFLFFYHFNNILKGRIVYEKNSNIIDNNMAYDKGWKLNIIEVFGQYWYLTWISPFIRSPLPGNGMDWQVSNKLK